MIPKVIHYCWFGRGELPDLAKMCIASWRKYMPDYEIIEWNEDNFDVNMIEFTRLAYAEKLYAFVSDFARFWVLYKFGGVYFDTDVEVLKDMEPIIAQGPYMGCENYASEGKDLRVNAGLGIACEAQNDVYADIIQLYKDTPFVKNQRGNYPTIVRLITKFFEDRGLKQVNKVQEVDGIKIYPADYFASRETAQDIIPRTENSYTVHHYMGSWYTKKNKLKLKLLSFMPLKVVRWLTSLKSYLKK